MNIQFEYELCDEHDNETVYTIHADVSAGSPGKTFVHLHPNTPDPSENTNVIDLQNVIDAVKFFRYPWFGPCSCLPEVECVFGGSCDDDGDCLEGGSPCQTNADCGIGLTCWHGFCTSATDQCGRCALP